MPQCSSVKHQAQKEDYPYYFVKGGAALWGEEVRQLKGRSKESPHIF